MSWAHRHQLPTTVAFHTPVYSPDDGKPRDASCWTLWLNLLEDSTSTRNRRIEWKELGSLLFQLETVVSSEKQ